MTRKDCMYCEQPFTKVEGNHNGTAFHKSCLDKVVANCDREIFFLQILRVVVVIVAIIALMLFG